MRVDRIGRDIIFNTPRDYELPETLMSIFTPEHNHLKQVKV